MVRLVGLTLTGLLVAFQLWFTTAPPSQRALVPGFVQVGAGVAADFLIETTDTVGDFIGPRWVRGWEKTKISLGLMKAPEPERTGLVATGQDLGGQDFTARRLAEAMFGRATLDGAVFDKAYLVRASLDGASAKGASFAEAVLERASLRGADLSGGTFTGADLTDAALDGADLSSADLSGAVGLTQAQLDTACGDLATRLPTEFVVRPCKAEPALQEVAAALADG
jgi:hypothetical protein